MVEPADATRKRAFIGRWQSSGRVVFSRPRHGFLGGWFLWTCCTGGGGDPLLNGQFDCGSAARCAWAPGRGALSHDALGGRRCSLHRPTPGRLLANTAARWRSPEGPLSADDVHRAGEELWVCRQVHVAGALQRVPCGSPMPAENGRHEGLWSRSPPSTGSAWPCGRLPPCFVSRPRGCRAISVAIPLGAVRGYIVLLRQSSHRTARWGCMPRMCLRPPHTRWAALKRNTHQLSER